jgi:hypothetical protein
MGSPILRCYYYKPNLKVLQWDPQSKGATTTYQILRCYNGIPNLLQGAVHWEPDGGGYGYGLLFPRHLISHWQTLACGNLPMAVKTDRILPASHRLKWIISGATHLTAST